MYFWVVIYLQRVLFTSISAMGIRTNSQIWLTKTSLEKYIHTLHLEAIITKKKLGYSNPQTYSRLWKPNTLVNGWRPLISIHDSNSTFKKEEKTIKTFKIQMGYFPGLQGEPNYMEDEFNTCKETLLMDAPYSWTRMEQYW